MRPAPDRLLPGGVRLVAAFRHEGAAKKLVHQLKYQGMTSFATLTAEVLAPRLTPLPLVPVPRSWSRRLKYGVDPARLIAQRLSSLLEVPVIDALQAPLHAPRRAGRDHSRPVAPYRVRVFPPSPVWIVDDVVTTGSTVLAAIAALGPGNVRGVVSANVVENVTSVPFT